MAFWSTKVAISLKRVRIERRLLWGAYRNSPSLFWTVPSPNPTASPSPRLGVRTKPNPKLQSLLSRERAKLRTSNLARTITVSIRIIAHEKLWRKGSVGVSRDCLNFLGTPYYLRNGKSYGFQIWQVYSQGPSEQNSIKKFGEKGAWAYPGTAQFFRVPPIISGTGKATDFKFCMHIYRPNRNKCPLKISGKVAVGVVRYSRKFSGHPYIGRIARSSLR